MPTRDEFFEIGIAEMLTGPDAAYVDETTLRTEGTNLNMILAAAAEMVAEEDYQRQLLLGDNLSIDTAQGDALSALGVDRYGTARQGATAAVGSVSVSRTTTVASVTYPAGSLLTIQPPDDADPVKVTLDEPLAMGIGVSSAGPVPVTATVAGPTGNVTDPSATIAPASLPQADIVFAWESATEPPLTGGNAEEDDEDYRERLRNFWANQSRGTVGAIENAALEVTNVREVAVYETTDRLGRVDGEYTVVVADENGNSNATLTAAVVVALLDYRPVGTPYSVIGGQVTWRDITFGGIFKSGLATTANDLAARQAVVAAVNRLSPNGAADGASRACTLTPELVVAAADATGLFELGSVYCTNPVGPEVPEQGYVFRTSLGRVTRG